VVAALLLDEVIAMPAKPSLDALIYFQSKEPLVFLLLSVQNCNRKKGEVEESKGVPPTWCRHE
jgi:hypothetical protein